MCTNATAFSFESISLICDFIGLTDATRKALQTSQYSVERPLTQLNYSYFQEQFVSEKVAAAGGAGQYTKSIDIVVPLRCNGLCAQTFWRLPKCHMRPPRVGCGWRAAGRERVGSGGGGAEEV